jgi:hypothetical protein
LDITLVERNQLQDPFPRMQKAAGRWLAIDTVVYLAGPTSIL